MGNIVGVDALDMFFPVCRPLFELDGSPDIKSCKGIRLSVELRTPVSISCTVASIQVPVISLPVYCAVLQVALCIH